MNIHFLAATDAFEQWINEDPTSGGVSIDAIGYGIATVVGVMIVLTVILAISNWRKKN